MDPGGPELLAANFACDVCGFAAIQNHLHVVLRTRPDVAQTWSDEEVDWTGRQVRGDKRGSIPKDLAPLLDRLAVDAEMWVSSAENFGRWFHRAAGRVERLMQAGRAAGRRWFQGLAPSRAAFG